MLWYMLMYLNIPLHDLHDRRPIWSDMTYPCSEGKTGCRRLWSIMYLFRTLLSCSWDSIYLAVSAYAKTCMAPTYTSAWGFATSVYIFCQCGQRHTVHHIAALCSSMKLKGGLRERHDVDDDAIR